MSHRSKLLLLATLIAVSSACAAEPQPPRAPEPAPLPRRAPPALMASPLAQASAAPTAAPAVSAAPEEKPALVAAVDANGCVQDPMAHAAQLIVSHHAATVGERLGRPPVLADFEQASMCFATSTLPDLDGDDVEETQVVEGCSWGNHGGLHALYLSNNGCTRFAGDLVSGELSPLTTQAAGVRDLEATWSNGCAGNDFSWTRYRWDGKAYRVVDEATCYLCDDKSISRPPAHANTHAHCKAEAKARKR